MESTKVATPLTWLALIALALFFLFKAIWMAWDDEGFFTSFLQWWLAGVLVIPSAVLPFVFAYWTATTLSKKTNNIGVLAVVALLAITISGATILMAVRSTPGIGWRYVDISADVFDR